MPATIRGNLMAHAHHHNSGDHGRHHDHAPANFDKAYIIGITLNTAFVILEAVYGIIGHSLALFADAGHNLSDVLALVLAWIASLLSKKRPTVKRTYGFRRSSILAALFNAVFLLVAIGAIAWQAISRFTDPTPVTGHTVILVAAVGIAINAATAFLFMSGRKSDINVRGAYLHMAADALVSVGVVIAGIIISFTNWLWLDPAASLVIVLVIFVSTWRLLIDSFNMALDVAPDSIDVATVKAYLASLPSVTEVHDLHIWAMSTTEVALTVHLVMKDLAKQDDVIKRASKELHDKYGIEHPTIQVENGTYACNLAPDEMV
jgi:cobalt-zinc-cadmium efflux system protein